MNRRVNVAFLGTGDMAQTHMRDMANLGDLYCLKALCDTNEKRLRAFQETFKVNVDCYMDHHALLDRKDIDAVIICTPNYLHLEHAVAAFESGKHVLLQKPMALHIRDCNTIIEAGRKAGKKLQVGLVYRYSPLFRYMAQVIQRGKIGRPLMAWCHEFRVPFPVGNLREWRYDEKLSGGSLVEKSCHHFDLFQWMLGGLPLRVHAFGGNSSVDCGKTVPPGVPGEPYVFSPQSVNNIIDHAWVNIEFPDDRKANYGLSLFSANRELPFGVLGDKGWIEVNVHRKTIFFHDGRPGHVEIIEPEKISHELADRGHSGGARELLEFAEAILQDTEPFCSGEIGRDSLLAAIAGELSIKEKRVIEISELLQ